MRAIVTGVLALAVGCAVEPEPDYTSYEVPSDCVVSGSFCCGGPVAVRADTLVAYRAGVCPEGPCVPASGCLCLCWTMQRAASCREGRCELVAPTPEELACASDDDCGSVAARCGPCESVPYCGDTSGWLAIRRDAYTAFGARVCGAEEHCTTPGWETANPRCVDGTCRPF